jgi:hypothetical protein
MPSEVIAEARHTSISKDTSAPSLRQGQLEPPSGLFLVGGEARRLAGRVSRLGLAAFWGQCGDPKGRQAAVPLCQMARLVWQSGVRITISLILTACVHCWGRLCQSANFSNGPVCESSFPAAQGKLLNRKQDRSQKVPPRFPKKLANPETAPIGKPPWSHGMAGRPQPSMFLGIRRDTQGKRFLAMIVAIVPPGG